MEDVNESSRTELDSHANMPVIGRNAYILSKIGETVDVAPFTPDYKPISVELVDAALKYECPYSGEVKILIIRRGLHVPSMTHNLLPPFMLREAGIQINDVPKIHVTSPSEEHHAIIFQETDFRIPLTLHGTFSYFPTSKPTTQELEKPEELTLNILPRFGESVMKMPKEPLMSLPKHPLEQMIQLSQETTPPMTGC